MVGAGPRVVLVAPLLMAFAAGAQAYPEAAPTFRFTPTSGGPSQIVDMSGTGCTHEGRPLAWADVDLSRNVRAGGGEPFRVSRRYPVRADGSWNGQFVIPAHAPPGPYYFGSSCATADVVIGGVDSTFLVLDNPAAAHSRCRHRGPVPRTTLTG